MLDNAHIQSPIANDDDLVERLATEGRQRWNKLRRVEVGLYRMATQLGENPEQARTKVEALFRAFVSEVFLYTLLGTDDLYMAVLADATMPWLDLDVSGKTIRERILENL